MSLAALSLTTGICYASPRSLRMSDSIAFVHLLRALVRVCCSPFGSCSVSFLKKTTTSFFSPLSSHLSIVLYKTNKARFWTSSIHTIYNSALRNISHKAFGKRKSAFHIAQEAPSLISNKTLVLWANIEDWKDTKNTEAQIHTNKQVSQNNRISIRYRLMHKYKRYTAKKAVDTFQCYVEVIT